MGSLHVRARRTFQSARRAAFAPARIPDRSLPSLGITRSAWSARSGAEIWARSRPRAASRVSPSRAIRRVTRSSSGASTVQKASKWWAFPRSTQRAASSTAPRVVGGSAARRAASRASMRGWRIAFSRARAASSENTWAAIQARSRAPSGRRQAGPKAATSAARPSLPGSTASRARASASSTAQPRAASFSATKLFPAAMPPLSPRMGKGDVCMGAPPLILPLTAL